MKNTIKSNLEGSTKMIEQGKSCTCNRCQECKKTAIAELESTASMIEGLRLYPFQRDHFRELLKAVREHIELWYGSELDKTQQPSIYGLFGDIWEKHDVAIQD
jgi:hypothetical protein